MTPKPHATVEGPRREARVLLTRRAGRLALPDETFARLFTSAPAAMVVLRLADGLIIDANDECVRLVGHPREQIVGRTVLDVGAWSKEDDKALRDLMLDRVGVRDLRLQLRTASGELRPVRCGAETTELDGETFVIATFIDDAEPERRLRESESQFRAAFMTGADAYLIVVRDDGRLVEVNDRFVEMFGYTREECRGRTSVEMGMWARPGQRARVLAALERDGRVRDLKIRCRRKGGAVFPVVYSATPFELDGLPPMLLVVLRDVTEEVQSRERLARSATEQRSSNALFRAAFMTGSDALVIGRRTDGAMLELNDRFVSMFGFGRDECVGRSADELGLFADTAQRDAMRAEADLHGMVQDLEGEARRKDGEVFHVRYSMTTLDLEGRPPLYLSAIRDVTAEVRARADLALEATITTALRSALEALPAGGSAEASAAAICAALVRLPEVSLAAIFGFGLAGQLVPIACDGTIGQLPPPSRAPTARIRRFHALAGGGAFAEWWQPLPDDGPWASELTQRGLRAAAFGPIRHQQHVDGLLVIGTTDEHFAHTLVERMPTIVDFSSTPSAVLAERIHAMREDDRARREIALVIVEHAFVPHFQPIVELSTGRVVGYEALTRFTSGQRPDHVFDAAWRVGLGIELELETLEAAIAAAARLPEGAWLDLNASPALIVDARPRLASVLDNGRQLVLEITEHAAIEDYAAVRDAVAALGADIWLGVDDAGAGIANFGHIVELRPKLVKIDIGLVRGVDRDPGRQALIVAMVRFAAEAGCRLVAEGIEHQAEADVLRDLGVDYGQGYLLGRPEPIPQA